jgi:CelD/BcsL family acetyltransferase involved in cellulose biosynthesis
MSHAEPPRGRATTPLSEEPGLAVTLGACPAAADLAPEWRALERDAEASFFTSWTWIGGWLQRLERRHQPQLLRATRHGRVVGLGILVPALSRRLKLLPSPSLHLHTTAERQHDDLSIEHNGLLLERGDAPGIAAAMLEELCEPRHRWQQLRFPGLSVPPPFPPRLPARMIARRESGDAYRVNLTALREGGGDYLARLSRNTRSQIRRSIKAYAALGPLRVTAAASLPEALRFLDRLKFHHQKAWVSRGAAGAFANPLFEQFHRQLIARGFASGEVQLLQAAAADHEIGYLYNFVHRGHVSCYQSGFHYGVLAGNHHPGMAVHALAIQHCTDLGLGHYDFLAGSERYKQQLATDRYPMFDLSIHRRSLSLRLEEAWRGLKKSLASEPATGPQATTETAARRLGESTG